eukprot:6199722-Pleurochrysis_carterae.AAC.4
MHVPWSVKNVPGTKPTTGLAIREFNSMVQCLGIESFAIDCSCAATRFLWLSHGSRGNARSDQRETNLYGPCSWRHSSRGTADELHWPVSSDHGSFTYRGLTQGLPVNYGRWMLSQLIVTSLRANYGLPSIFRRDAMLNALLNERLWHWETGEFATFATHLGSDFGLKQVLGSVAEEVGPDNEEIVRLRQ